MSALAIGLAFTAGSLILFAFSWYLAMRADRIAVTARRPAPPPAEPGPNPSGNDNQVAGLERSRPV